jgi:hypothetical protein
MLKFITKFYYKFILTGLYLALFQLNASSQVSRVWNYNYAPPNSMESSGFNVAVLPSGKAVTAGIYSGFTSSVDRNILLFTDNSGNLIDVDTSTLGFGFIKVVYNEHSGVIAAGTLSIDSIPISKILVTRFDTSFSNKRFFIPDSTLTMPSYQVLDMTVLSNTNILVASNWDAFPLRCLSLVCMDTSGALLWELVDSTFEFSYDVKLLADSAGGLFVAGSGRDTSNGNDFIFVSHFTGNGIRDWTIRYYSPAQNFADLTDVIYGDPSILYISGNVMDTSGQVGFLMKLSTSGNIVWNIPVLPLAFNRILSDDSGMIYGFTVPQNGIEAFKIYKLDSTGIVSDSNAFQIPGNYFTSELGDVAKLSNGLLAATGTLFDFSNPQSDLYFTVLDTSLNLVGFDIYDSLNLLGDAGRSMVINIDETTYISGRFNYDNQIETSTIGLVKYDFSGITANVLPIENPGFEIFPNPSSGNFNIRSVQLSNEQTVVRIIDSMGREVYNWKRDDIKSHRNIDLNLTQGLYTVIVEAGGQRSNKKVVILK